MEENYPMKVIAFRKNDNDSNLNYNRPFSPNSYTLPNYSLECPNSPNRTPSPSQMTPNTRNYYFNNINFNLEGSKSKYSPNFYDNLRSNSPNNSEKYQVMKLNERYSNNNLRSNSSLSPNGLHKNKFYYMKKSNNCNESLDNNKNIEYFRNSPEKYLKNYNFSKSIKDYNTDSTMFPSIKQYSEVVKNNSKPIHTSNRVKMSLQPFHDKLPISEMKDSFIDVHDINSLKQKDSKYKNKLFKGFRENKRDYAFNLFNLDIESKKIFYNRILP